MYQYDYKSNKSKRNLYLSYSYRTGHRDHTSLTAPVSVLSKESTPTLAGELNAILAYDSELGISNDISSYDNFLNGDKGHAFARLIIGSRPTSGLFLPRYYNWVDLSNHRNYCGFTDSFSSSLFSNSPLLNGTLCPPVGPSKSEFRTEATNLLWDMYPGKFQGSLGQDLVDIVELPRILTKMRELKRLAEEFNSLPNRVKDTIDDAFRKAKSSADLLKYVPKKTSSAYLQWLFVFQPYISDIQLVLKVLTNASSGLYSAQRRYKSSRLTTGSFTTNPSTSIEPSDVVLRPNSVDVHWLSSNWFQSSIWFRYDIRVVAKFRNVRPTEVGWARKAQDLNKKLGVFYPSLLWDLAPWTFVIDWFLHIGDKIDRAYALSSGDYPLDFAYATLKFDALTQFSLRKDVSFYVEKPVMAKATTSSLYRFPISLQDGTLPSWSGVSADEKNILIALGLANLH